MSHGSMARRIGRILVLGLAVAAAGPLNSVHSQDSWDPFKEKDEARKRKAATNKEPEQAPLTPMDGINSRPWARPAEPGPRPAPGRPEAVERLPMPSERERAVERSELAPILAGDGTGLPPEFWQGVDARSVQALVTRLEIPPRSPAMHGLWKRLWLASARPAPGPDGDRFEALRIEALYRSGLLKDLVARLEADRQGAPQDPLYQALAARARVAAGELKTGCADALALSRSKGEVPKAIKAEMLLIGGLCAAADGNQGAASLAAELARAEGLDAPLPLQALDAFAAGQTFKPELGKRLSLLDYRFLAVARSIDFATAVERGEPALLVALATDASIEHVPARRVQAAEMAARLNALTADDLALVYRAQTFAAADMAEPLTARTDPLLRRALLLRAVEGERTPQKRTRLARALLDDARRAGLYMPVAVMLAGPVTELAPAPEIGWFAETAIEVALAAGRYDLARKWVDFAGRGDGSALGHWLVLADVADPKWQGPRGASLEHAERFAVRGRIAPDLLHRLATVLDALDYQIPIPLWEAASRTPQPSSGHLPETGVLTELQDAAKKKEIARTVLLVLHTLGPEGADRAHLIGLGDAIRALRRAGLEADARRLALEALLAGWPRSASN